MPPNQARMSAPTSSARAFVPALEGLRGVAVVLVVVSHVLPRNDFGAALGGIGVTTFFTLSGFLITGVLQNGPLRSVRALCSFFLARFVRLFPALLLLITVTSAIWLLQGRSPVRMAEYAATSLLYLENFFAVAHDQQILVHTWSLAVEEQFYLLWPFALLLVTRLTRRWTRALLFGAILFSVALKIALEIHGHGTAAYTSLPTNAYALLLGAAFRCVPTPLALRRPSAARIGWTGYLLVVGAIWLIPHSIAISPILAAICTVPIIFGSLPGSRFLDLRPVRFLGRISYAWYLWHWPVLWLAGALHDPVPAALLAMVSMLIASVSTILIEEPLRHRYRAAVQRRRSRSSHASEPAALLGSAATTPR